MLGGESHLVTDTSLLSELSSVATVVFGRTGQTTHVTHVGTTFFGCSGAALVLDPPYVHTLHTRNQDDAQEYN